MAAETKASPAIVQIAEPENLFGFIPKRFLWLELLALKFVPHSPDGLNVPGLYRISLEFLSQPPEKETM